MSFLNLDAMPVRSLLDLMGINACAQMRSLDFSQRRLGACGTRMLAERLRGGACPELDSLNLTACGIGPGGAEALSIAMQTHGLAPSLRLLRLAGNGMGSRGVTVLAKALKGGAGEPPGTRHGREQGERGGHAFDDRGA